MNKFLLPLCLLFTIVLQAQKDISADKQELIQSIESRENELVALSDEIWALAETAFEENQSAKLLADFAEKGKTDPLFRELARLVEETHGIWNEKAERYLLAKFGVDIGEAAA